MKHSMILPATAIAIAMLVACAPQSRDVPQSRVHPVVPAAADKGMSAESKAIVASADKVISEKRGASPTKVDANIADLNALVLIEDVSFLSGDKDQGQKIIVVSRNLKGDGVINSVLSQSKTDKTNFSNENDASTAEKFSVFVVSNDNGTTKLIVYSDSTQGRIDVTKQEFRDLKLSSTAILDSDNKVHVTVISGNASDTPVASADQMALIADVQKQLSGAATLQTLTLKSQDGSKSVVRNSINFNNNVVILTERTSQDDKTFILKQEGIKNFKIITLAQQSETMFIGNIEIAANTTFQLSLGKDINVAAPAPPAKAAVSEDVPASVAALSTAKHIATAEDFTEIDTSYANKYRRPDPAGVAPAAPLKASLSGVVKK